MGCKQCWRKLRNKQGIYICSTCTQAKPFPRDTEFPYMEYMPTLAKFAEFTFFGKQGIVIIGKEADHLLEETRGRNEDTPHEILNLVGKNFIVAVAPSNKTFDNDYCHFQVQAMEHVANPELLVPLPLSNVTHSDLAGQYPSSALVLTGATQSDQLATPPPVNFASQKNEKIQPKEHQASYTEEIPQGEKGEH